MAIRLAVVGCFVLAAAPARAVVPAHGAPLAADTLTALPAAGIAKPLRVQPQLLFGNQTPTFPWAAFVAAEGGTWQTAWDAATGVPTRIWGSGIAAPGASASASVAEAFAWRVLGDHLALFAPGSAITDFELASDVDDGDIRAIGFYQRAGGRRVVGGQVSFLFKRDRLFVIGSEALPYVGTPSVQAHAATAALRAQTISAVRLAVGLPNAPVSTPDPEVVLPLVGDSAVLGYRVAAPVTIDGGAAGKYLAYTDPATGAVIAAVQQNLYATGTVLYHGVDRYPDHGYVDRPAPRAFVQVNNVQQTTTQTGGISWSPDATVAVATSVNGDLVSVVNKAMNGMPAAMAFVVAPGGQIVWDATAAVVVQADGTMDHEDDAQVQAYLDNNIVKEYVRANIDPGMMTLDDQMVINTNLDQACNAFFDGKALNFFHATSMGGNGFGCENTGRIQDVGFHEYGHRVHTAEIIPGVGAFDGAMSEGVADFLAVSVTGDHGMGRGFFFNKDHTDDDTPLRDLDPPDGTVVTWPTDIGEIHHTGLIIGGSFWDLRTALIAELGETQGVALVDRLYVGALRRSINIPTSLIEVLATDDDDGDLSNGTPHECEIRAAFGRHGLRTATGFIQAPGALETNAASIGIVAQVTGLSANCTGDELASAQFGWQPGGNGLPTAGYIDAMMTAPDQFFAEIPLSPQDTVSFSVHVQFTDQTQLVLPDNLADPFYQLYQGHTVKLYCTDFETDPFAAGWTTGADDGMPSPWQWGTPTAGPTDPHAAFSGTHVLAQTIDGDYPAMVHSWVAMPEIDVGQYSDVRLQYRRWLAVEDSHFDQARILTNDRQVWENATNNMGDSSQLDHIDKEWIFQDVPVSGFFHGRKLDIKWDLKSDATLQLGGWALDDVCVVANPYAICGDGIKSRTEACDNGPMNADRPDACRTDCSLPTCGDNIVDSDEECDDGPMGSTTCTNKCKLIAAAPGGCCSTGGGPGSLALAALVGGLVLRRRRGRPIPRG